MSISIVIDKETLYTHIHRIRKNREAMSTFKLTTGTTARTLFNLRAREYVGEAASADVFMEKILGTERWRRHRLEEGAAEEGCVSVKRTPGDRKSETCALGYLRKLG